MESRRWFVAGIAVLTLLASLAIAFDISPYLRGPDEWRWHFGIPSRPLRHLIPIGVVAAYVAITMFWMKGLDQQAGTGWRQRAFLFFLVLSVPLIQASLYVVEDPDVLEQPFYRTISPTSSGAFSVGSTINDPVQYLREYPQKMPSFPTHPQRYPPGLPLLFYGARRLLERLPNVSDAIAFRLRLYQCHNLILMRLSNAAIASSVVQMMLPITSGLVVLPIYGLARRAMGERVALWAAMLYPLVPSFNLWFARWDAFYALLAATIWLLFYIGLVESCLVSLTASGFLLSVASFFSFGNLALLLPMGCWTVLWLSAHRDLWSWRGLILDALVFGAGFLSLWALYQIALGTGFVDIWRVSMSYHLGLGRSYWLWLGYHIYDFFLFLGLPLALLFFFAIAVGMYDARRRQETLLPIGLGLGILLLDLSGMSQGEVARVWLFLTPLATIAAALGLARLHCCQVHAVLVVSLLGIQLLTFNAFLRVVNTGLYDPPERDRVFSAPSIAFPQRASLGDRVTLLGYDIASRDTQPAGTIQVKLYWQPTAPIANPYTVFTHLVDSSGRLMAQHDDMPVEGSVPTTCWVPGEVIMDPHEIAVGAHVSPGQYHLETGLYLWRTGERLPSEGEGALPDGRIGLTQISVGVD